MTTTRTALILCLTVLACGCQRERLPSAPEQAVLEVVAPADIEERKRLAMSVIRELSGEPIQGRTARRRPLASAASLEALRVGMLTESKPIDGGSLTRVYLECHFDPASDFVRAEGRDGARRTEARDVLDACRNELQQALKASGEPRADDRRG
jgi:hypothetical protein